MHVRGRDCIPPILSLVLLLYTSPPRASHSVASNSPNYYASNPPNLKCSQLTFYAHASLHNGHHFEGGTDEELTVLTGVGGVDEFPGDSMYGRKGSDSSSASMFPSSSSLSDTVIISKFTPSDDSDAVNARTINPKHKPATHIRSIQLPYLTPSMPSSLLSSDAHQYPKFLQSTSIYEPRLKSQRKEIVRLFGFRAEDGFYVLAFTESLLLRLHRVAIGEDDEESVVTLNNIVWEVSTRSEKGARAQRREGAKARGRKGARAQRRKKRKCTNTQQAQLCSHLSSFFYLLSFLAESIAALS